LHRAIGAEVLISPHRTCINVDCPDHGKPLQNPHKPFLCHLFTVDRGVLPIRVLTLYCKACRTTYRPNYSVSDADSPLSVRRYHKGLPDVIDASEHYYFDTRFMSLVRAQMAFAHASGETVARIYNLGLSGDVNHPHSMDGDHVWQAFYLHALLLDAARRTEILCLPHRGKQAERFRTALALRNLRMAGTGQPQWAHACNECEKVSGSADPSQPQSIACVMDGVTLGHPRCIVTHCVGRLSSPRDRFCEDHSHLSKVCAIDGCQEPCSDGMRTCGIDTHRAFEKRQRERGQAFYRLKRRMETKDALAALGRGFASSPDLDPDPQLINQRTLAPKAPAPEQPLTWHGIRAWTHNEQLIVKCCGVLLSRATFYTAESPSNCLRFLLATFPSHYPRSRPSFCFFDNNCILLKHILATNESRLQGMGLPVDVFHAVTKHKDTDEFCRMNCNPATFPELYDQVHRKWIFNSSAAEQTNAWFGQFQPLVREMREENHNFFLDEMILIHNEWQVAVLFKRGAQPRLVPIEEL
ncbi:hypothetical protein L226DRAFT_433281, partial [Lentinus tigrinus ALCF2SS1-7]